MKRFKNFLSLNFINDVEFLFGQRISLLVESFLTFTFFKIRDEMFFFQWVMHLDVVPPLKSTLKLKHVMLAFLKGGTFFPGSLRLWQ